MNKLSEEAAGVQAKVYRHLRRYIDKPCPTNKQIGKSLGLSEATVAHRVRQLADQGYIRPINLESCKRKIQFSDGAQTDLSRPKRRKAKPKPKPREFWLEEEKTRAWELRSKGFSSRQIATHLGKSRSAVCSFFHREMERDRGEHLVRNGEVTLAKYALGKEARKQINETWERLSA